MIYTSECLELVDVAGDHVDAESIIAAAAKYRQTCPFESERTAELSRGKLRTLTEHNVDAINSSFVLCVQAEGEFCPSIKCSFCH